VLPTTCELIAAIGATLAALRAGRSAATTVTPIPTPNATTAVRGWKASPPAGMPKPSASSSALRPAAMPSPAASPRKEARSPMTTASTSTDPSTWPRLAPSARSRPFSRVR
jgi:hypothetical protein